MKKSYALLSALLLAAVSLCAQTTVPTGYIEKGAFSESFTDGFETSSDWSSSFAVPFGWGYQQGTPSKSYSTSTSSAVNGKYVSCSSNFLQTDQTAPILLITPMLKGAITFYIRPYNIGERHVTTYLANNKSWVRIYGGTLNTEDGTITWDLETPLFNEVFTAVPTGADSNGWIQRTFTTTDYKFLGIQMSYAGFDELTAENHCMLIKKVVNPTKIASDYTDSNPLYANADGEATWTGTVTVKNEGDEEIAANTVTLAVASGATYSVTTTTTELVLSEAIPAGEAKDFVLTLPVKLVNPLADGRSAIKITSTINNVTNKDLTAQSSWFTVKTLAPKLVVKNASDYDVTSNETKLGLVKAPASTTFKLSSTGGSPVVLNSITSTIDNLTFTADDATLSFPLTIEKGTSKTITMTFGNMGSNSGTLTFNYANNYDETTYTVESKTVSVVVADPALYLEEFASTLPQGWINEDGSNWACRTAGGTPANSYVYNSRTGENTLYLISPKLHFDEGQTLSVMAGGQSTSAQLTVLTSTDRCHWTEVAKKTTWTTTVSTSSFKTENCELITINMPAGDCYVAFASGYALIDYIMGGTKVTVTDDLYATISGADDAMVNYEYALAVSLTNLAEIAYADKDIVLELKNGDAVVATDTLPAIEALKSGIKDTLRFTPHTAETATLTLTVKKGEDALITLTKDITVAEETVAIVVVTGTQEGTTDFDVPLYTNYYNSKSEFIYTADKIGLAKGTNLTSLTFPYYNTSKEISGDVKIWLQNTDDDLVGDAFTDVETMTNVFTKDGYVFPQEGYSSACVDRTFTFSAPFAYTGGNLRVVICCEDENKEGGYTRTGWGYETVSNSVIYKYNDTYATYLNAAPTKKDKLPIAKIGYSKELPTISGEVILADGSKAGAGKKIEAKSGEVIYTTTTTAEGTYSVTILQDGLTYDLYLDGEKVSDGIVLNETTLVDNTVTVNINLNNTGTGVADIATEAVRVRKVLLNGHLYIERGATLYNINGQVVK